MQKVFYIRVDARLNYHQAIVPVEVEKVTEKMIFIKPGAYTRQIRKANLGVIEQAGSEVRIAWAETEEQAKELLSTMRESTRRELEEMSKWYHSQVEALDKAGEEVVATEVRF